MNTLIALTTLAAVINPLHGDLQTTRLPPQAALPTLDLFVPPVAQPLTVASGWPGDHPARALTGCTAGA